MTGAPLGLFGVSSGFAARRVTLAVDAAGNGLSLRGRTSRAPLLRVPLAPHLVRSGCCLHVASRLARRRRPRLRCRSSRPQEDLCAGVGSVPGSVDGAFASGGRAIGRASFGSSGAAITGRDAVEEDVAALVDSASSCRSPPPSRAGSAAPRSPRPARRRRRLPARASARSSRPRGQRALAGRVSQRGARRLAIGRGLRQLHGRARRRRRGRHQRGHARPFGDGGRDAGDPLDRASSLSVGAFDSGDALVGHRRSPAPRRRTAPTGCASPSLLNSSSAAPSCLTESNRAERIQAHRAQDDRLHALGQARAASATGASSSPSAIFLSSR